MAYQYEIDGEFATIYRNGKYFDEIDLNALIEQYIDKVLKGDEEEEVEK